MDAKIVAAGLVATTVGLFFLNRWLVRRANRKYAEEVAALTLRIRAKEVARVEAELDAMIAEGVPRMPKLDLTGPLADLARAGTRVKGLPPTPLAAWPTPTAAEMAEAKAGRARQAARPPANAYDARKALVRHQHESVADTTPTWPGAIPSSLFEQPAPAVSGSGGTFDGGGASGDWSSPSTDSSTSSDSGPSNTSD